MTAIISARDDEGGVRHRIHAHSSGLVSTIRRIQNLPAPRVIPAQPDDGGASTRQLRTRNPARRTDVPERRAQERRRRRVPVLLDTRSGMANRRRRLRRSADEPCFRQYSRDQDPGPPAGTVLGDDFYA